MKQEMFVVVCLLLSVTGGSSGVRGESRCGVFEADAWAVMGGVTRLSREEGTAQLMVIGVVRGEETWTGRFLKLTGVVGERECDGLLELGDRRIFYSARDGDHFSLQGFTSVENVQEQGNLQRGRSQFTEVTLTLALCHPLANHIFYSTTIMFCGNGKHARTYFLVT